MLVFLNQLKVDDTLNNNRKLQYAEFYLEMNECGGIGKNLTTYENSRNNNGT